MPRVVSKGSITGRSAFSNGGLGLSIGTRATKGIRHAISRRAPDSVKINGDPVPDYKIRDIDGVGAPVLLTNTVVPTKPYLKSIQFSYDDVVDPPVPLEAMFTNKLINIVLIFATPAYTGVVADEFTVGLLSGSNIVVETLITQISKNNYTFTLPAMTHSPSGTNQNVTEQITVYYNGVSFNTTDTNAETISATVLGTSADTNYNEFNTLIKPLLFGKTFNITLTADNVFNIPTTGGINCGTYIYTAPAP